MFDSIKILIILATILGNFSIGILAIRRNIKSIVNRTMAVFAFVFSLWSLSLFFYDYPLILDSLFWIKLTYVIVVYGIIGCMYYFAYIFPTGKSFPPRWGQVSFFVLATALAYVFLFSDLIVKGVTQTPTGFNTQLSSYYLLFILFDSFYGFWGLGLLIYKYLKAKGYIKAQLKYLFLGLSCFVITVLILDSAIPLLTGSSYFFSVSTVGSLFFVGFTAYSIIRYRLLDIRIAIQEVVIFLMTTLLIFALCAVGAITYWVLRGEAIKVSVFLVLISVSLIITIVFERLSQLAKVFARDVLSLSAYDYQKTLKDLSLGLSVHLELDKLIDTLTKKLVEIFKLKKAALLIYSETDHKYLLKKSLGFSERGEEVDKLCSGQVLDFISRFPQILVLEEIKKLSDELANEVEKNNLKKIAQVMEENAVSLIIPLVGNDKITSLIILGDKASFDPYTVQDINFLNTVANEASIAFQNAKSYEEIKRFSTTLQEEVNKATMDLKTANDRLKQLDQLKDDFVSVASHELRTPMAAIRSYAWMALHRADVPLSKTVEKYVARILLSTERLINLVNDMLNVSRIESGRVEINPEPVDLLSLIKDIVDELYYSKSEEKDIQFVVLEKPVPKVFADPEKLRQVFLNLVGNSLKFTPAGGKITFDLFSDGKVVEISVSDTGVGIPQEDLSKLFHKFSRLDNSYTAAATSGGTGLGLYISKNLIELMHGKIWANSEGLNKGSTFTLSLPVANAEILAHADEYKVRAKGEVKGLEPVAL